MKFDKIIMNPPYSKNLHIKILNNVLNYLNDFGVCVNLSPIPRLSSIRNIWNELARKKFNEVKAYRYLVSCEKLNGVTCIELFGASMQQHIGITVYSSKIQDIFPEKFVRCPDISNSLIKKLMKKCTNDSLAKYCGNGEYKLPLSEIHGHIGNHDFFNIMSMTYESQLNSKGVISVYFKSDSDRRKFYEFWVSDLGKFLVSLWKVDTHVMKGFIPYFWCDNVSDFQKYFELTEKELKEIENYLNFSLKINK